MPSDNSVFMVPNFLVLRYLLVKKYQFDLKKSYRSSIWRKFILKPLPIDNPPNPLRIDRYENTACLSVLLPDIPSHCHNDITLCARILLCNVSDTKNNRIIILTARVGVLAVGCHQPSVVTVDSVSKVLCHWTGNCNHMSQHWSTTVPTSISALKLHHFYRFRIFCCLGRHW